MENAVQSLLQVPNLSPANVARALLLRAKCRLAAGYRTSAQQGSFLLFFFVSRRRVVEGPAHG